MKPIVRVRRGGSPVRKDFQPRIPGFSALEEVHMDTDEREDWGLLLAGLALVLEVVRLLAELL